MKNKKIDQFRILKSGDYVEQLWKNGQGSTHEIAIEPLEGALAADFKKNRYLFRLSRAAIKVDGDFSLFPEHDRVLVLISGGGVKLTKSVAEEPRILKTREIFRFSGNSALQCCLLDGTVEDFNVFYQRNCIQAQVDIVDLAKNSESAWFSKPGWNFLFSVNGQLDVENQPVAPGETVATALVSEGQGRSFKLKNRGAKCWLVAINLALSS